MRQSRNGALGELTRVRFVALLQSTYVTCDRVFLKFEARVQIYVAVLNIGCDRDLELQWERCSLFEDK